MTFAVLKLAHIIGAILIGAGLIGVWLSDMRSRESRELVKFSEAVRNVAVFYDGVIVTHRRGDDAVGNGFGVRRRTAAEKSVAS
jgi:hypothetical protein